jgi:glutamate/aspartate transport system permease protein
MFFWYFVLPELLPSHIGMAIKQMDPPWGSFVPALICLGLFTAARIAEQVRAGIQALPRGQTQAALALGFTRGSMYRVILLP